MDGPVAAQSRVVATAGHVDHGKSSLIVALTGIDPDRWDEEKRRGLTIDLGYAWCTLPSGREIAFVDVPGHERFIGNMLAGVGPVRSVLFVVAADEGWKPQSEEHLQILDVLGASSAVVALTKRDLVDEETAAIATEEVRDRLAGTALFDAPIVAVSASTGDGIDALRAALDDMLERVPPPDPARTRLHIDRVFTIKGAGTVVTGTLTGDCLSVGDDVVLLPSNRRARVRSLQSHRTVHDRACPVSRVAINLVGIERDEVARGDVLARPGAWRPTDRFEATPSAGAWPSTRRRCPRRVQGPCRHGRGRRAHPRLRWRRRSPPATTRSSGSTRPRRWPSTSSIASSCARRGGRKPWPAAGCSMSTLRAAPDLHPASGSHRGHAPSGTPCPACSPTNAAPSGRPMLRCSPGPEPRAAPSSAAGSSVPPCSTRSNAPSPRASAPTTRPTRWRRAPMSAPSAPR